MTKTQHLYRWFVLVSIWLCHAAHGDEATTSGFRMIASTGIEDVLPFEEDHADAFLYHSGHAGGAICMGDVNGDKRPDLYFSRALRNNALYLNQGDFQFQKQTGPFEKSEAWGTGAVLVDIDSDGDLDIFQVNYDAPVQLFINDGKGQFIESADAFGLGITDAALTISFADADNDGDLDAFLMCNSYYRAEGRPKDPPFVMKDGRPVTKPEFEKYYQINRSVTTGKWDMEDYGRRDYFFLNDGTRTRPHFRDVSKATRLDQFGYGLSCVWWDYNGDGKIDLSVSNDFAAPDRLYRNEGVTDGVPRFKEVIGDVFPTGAWSSMGSGIADINNDGLAELMTVDMSARSHFKSKLNMGEMVGDRRWLLENGWPRQMMRNHVYFNAGKGNFREQAWMLGLASTDWSWAVKWGDYDEDGWNDVLVTNGMTRNFTDSDRLNEIGDINQAMIGKSQWDLYRDHPPMLEANVVFHNQGGKHFKEVGKDWNLDLVGISFGASSGDLDGDGDLDLVVTDLGKTLKVYENQMGNQGGRLRVRLTGTKSNAMGIGAKVTVTDEQENEKTRWMLPWMGFQSQDDSVLHFGLANQNAKKVEVTWPTGEIQTVAITGDQQEITITETGGVPRQSLAGSPLWKPTPLPWRHQEKPFDDFANQPLLPGKLSQQGPCIASGDIDQDGDLDAYLGGAANQAGRLLVNFDGNLKVGAASWGAAEKSEDVAALWFDADGDKDLDLYVVSGSVEHQLGDELYRDRFYRNDLKNGNLGFNGMPEALPDLRDSGSCVTAADFDNDGDLDLFVGSRCVVGKYPESPKSRLLRNDSTKDGIRFTEVTTDVAPGLLAAGMVTDASWADLDGDNDPDLALAVEWGPIRVFWNDAGNLAERPDATNDANLIANRTGWWQSVRAGDFDGDGDIDLLAGNVGWNTKYKHPIPGKPLELYYGDMDGSGTSRIVEAKNSDGSLLPVRGKSCSSHAIPALREKFPSYRKFALSDLTGIYGEKCLSDAQRFVATELASGMWKNDGKGNFEWMELPWEVQTSQVNDFAVGDIDGDGKAEVVVAQNEDAREPETGLWRGGLGVVLRYDTTKDQWQVIPTAKTGFVLKGAAQAIELIDVNGDGQHEALVGQNGANLLLFGSPK